MGGGGKPGGSTPVLPKNVAQRLEAIFSREGWPTFQEFQDELSWLANLDVELNYVWASSQRIASRITSLKGDYLSALGL